MATSSQNKFSRQSLGITRFFLSSSDHSKVVHSDVVSSLTNTKMSGNSRCNVYIGNLDERVSERVLYDILIQAGRVVDLYIPRDKETDKPKGYAFAEYETQEIADYAIKLFNGLVTLYNRTLRFAFSGQDKNSQNSSTTGTPLSSRKSRTDPVPIPVNSVELSHQSMRISAPYRVSSNPASVYSPEEPPPPGVTVTHQGNGYGASIHDTNYEYSRRVFGATMDSISRSRSRRFDISNPTSYAYH